MIYPNDIEILEPPEIEYVGMPTSILINSLLEQEIKFHEENKSVAYDKSDDWKNGFIAGLKHVKQNILSKVV